jgi:hypothetical protein
MNSTDGLTSLLNIFRPSLGKATNSYAAPLGALNMSKLIGKTPLTNALDVEASSPTAQIGRLAKKWMV